MALFSSPRAARAGSSYPWLVIAALLLLVLAPCTPADAQQTWPCPLRSVDRTVTICRPVSSVTYDSPIRVLAGSAHSQVVYRMQVYLDGVKVYQQNGDQADTNLIVTPGTHRLTVQAVDALGTFKETIYVTIRNRSYPRFAYLANSDGTTSAFTIEADSGYLRHDGYVLSGDKPSGIASTWRGFVYVADNGDGHVFGYKRAQDGRLVPIAGSPFECCATCRDIAIDAAGKFAYVLDGHHWDVKGFSINASTGALTPLSQSPVPAGEVSSSITISSRGAVFVTNWATNDVSAYVADSTSGALTPVAGSPFKAGTAPAAAAVDPFGTRLYVVNSILNTISAFKIYSGKLSSFGGTIATGSEPVSIAMYPSGGFIFVANKASNSISVYKLDIDGLPKLTGTFATASSPSALKVDVQGKYLYVAQSSAPYEISVYKINLTTGALTYLRKVRTRANGTALAVAYGPASVSFVPGYIYVGTANRTTKTGKIFAFSIGDDGALTPVSGSPWSHPTGVVSLAVHPTGKMLYAPGFEPAQFQGLIGQYKVNLSTGALSSVGAYTQQPEVQSPNMVVEASGRFAYATSPMYDGVEQGFWGWSLTSTYTLGGWLWYGGDVLEPFIFLEPTGRYAYEWEYFDRINSKTGQLELGAYHQLDYDSKMVAYPSGRFMFSVSTESNQITSFSISGSTGKLTMTGTALSTGQQPVAVTIEPYGNFVYVANKGSNNVTAYKVNRTNGTLTKVGTYTAGTSPVGITADPSGRYIYVVNEVSMDISAYRINQTTGALTAVVGSPYHLSTSGMATSIINIGIVR